MHTQNKENIKITIPMFSKSFKARNNEIVWSSLDFQIKGIFILIVHLCCSEFGLLNFRRPLNLWFIEQDYSWNAVIQGY